MKLRRLLTLLLAWAGSAVHVLSIAALLIAGVGIAPAVQAASAVTGSVSFDAASQLYTYTYVLDPAFLQGGNIGLSVRQNIAVNFLAPRPEAHAEPDGFMFVLTSSANGVGPPLNISGSYWGWWSTSSNAVYDKDLVFSFSTQRGVSTDTANNFYVFSTGYTGGPPGNEIYVDFGQIVGPELVNIPEPDSPVPESSKVVMFLAGAVLLLCLAARRGGWRSKYVGAAAL